ncbi:MAG: hypothetical protein JJE25_05420, partial [Bacteroidia bacterium]|nr:hypothetical protein [Bacteroidia bacterium]
SLHSPIAVLHYEFYKNDEDISEKLYQSEKEIQCVTCRKEIIEKFINQKLSLVLFGQTQKPMLWDYADGVDTMQFLLNLKH